MTRWPKCLKRYPLSQIAPLSYLPDTASKPVLHELALSIDRLVEAANLSVCEDKINIFAQNKSTVFLTHGTAYDRPLMIRLQKSTYRQYKGFWKRRLCFLVRRTNSCQPVELSHRLTPQQAALLDRTLSDEHKLQGLRPDQSHLEQPHQSINQPS